MQSQSGDFSGNVFDFFNMVYPKITADFKKPFMTEGAYRVEETPKHLAVREALANCLVNADYFQSWSVVIERYPDRIVMSNPGTIILGKKQMLHGGISEPRNKNLFKMFNLLGIGEHSGSGVPDIFDVWSTEGLETPIVEEQFGVEAPDRTTLILPLVEREQPQVYRLSEKGDKKGEKKGDEKAMKKSDEIATRVKMAYEVICSQPDITVTNLAQTIGVTKKQTEKAIGILKETGRISREGPTNGGHWIIHK